MLRFNSFNKSKNEIINNEQSSLIESISSAINEDKVDFLKEKIKEKQSIFIIPEDLDSALEVNHILNNTLNIKELQDNTSENFIDEFNFDDDNYLIFFIFYNQKIPEYSYISVSKDIFHDGNAGENTIFYPKEKNILRRLYNLTPEYKPRKFVYESIDNNQRIGVRCYDRESCVNFEKLLHDKKWTYNNDDTYLVKNGNWDKLTFVKFNIEDKTFTAIPGVNPNYDYYDISYKYPEDQVKINNILKFNPSYKPKKFIYESNEIKDIRVWCDDREKCVNFEKYLHDKGWTYPSGDMYIVKRGDYYTLTFFKFDVKNKTFSAVRGRSIGEYNFKYPEDKDKINILISGIPQYKPRKFIYERKEQKVLYAFDMDDTLTYSKRFEEHVKPLLLREYLTPEIILNNKLEDIGIGLEKLKYENGRIYFDDPHHEYKIPKGSDWVRKKDRIYIVQPNAFLMTDESMPIGTYDDIVKLYNEAEYKCIITARSERLRRQTIKALNNLGIEKPNMGLFMYPNDSFAYTYEYKSNKLLEIYKTMKFDEIHYYDDNIKLLKKIKENLKNKDINIKYYKVTKNRYRQI